MKSDQLEWSTWRWNRCHARKERRMRWGYWGRCELRKRHEGDHALERGMELIRWSTDSYSQSAVDQGWATPKEQTQ